MSGPSRPELVLASASPRRARILSMLGLDATVDPADVDERAMPGETPAEHVERLAREKASAVATRHSGALVLAGDTVVVRDGAILGKPESPGHATDLLLGLAGRTHTVVTGLALVAPARGDPSRGARALSRVDRAEVRFRSFERSLAEAYVATGEPLDKAGAYAIQGMGAALVTRVQGDYYTVVGLPVSGLLALLERAGWRFTFDGLVETRVDRDPLRDRP